MHGREGAGKMPAVQKRTGKIACVTKCVWGRAKACLARSTLRLGRAEARPYKGIQDREGRAQHAVPLQRSCWVATFERASCGDRAVASRYELGTR